MLVLTNERAGRTEQESVAAVVAELATATPVELFRCRQAADLHDLLARRDGRPVVVIGGDGSLHAFLRHLWHSGQADDCPVGVVPLGTGNDFARAIGMPLDPRDAARALLPMRERRADLIVDDAGGVVVNAVHVGVGAHAAVAARPLKPYLRQVSFPIGAAVAGARARGWRLRVEVDGTLVADGRRRALMVGVSNAPTIAGGSGLLAPGASPFDGRCHVTVSSAVGPLARIGYAARLRRGTHHGSDDVLGLTGTTVTVSGEEFHTNADGETRGPMTGRSWTVRPAAWRCLVPAPADRR